MADSGFEEFVAIVDRGSVSGAADQLGVPRPTVSKRLARLEDRLGVRLLHRTTRRLVLTEQGELLYQRARSIVHATREAEAAVQRHDNTPRGLLRVLVPPGVASTSFSAWVAEFLEKYPDVNLDVVSSELHVDMVAEGFDVALRTGPIEDESLVSRTLVKNSLIAVASPHYLHANGTPATAQDLDAHVCIVGYKSGNVPDHAWPLLDGRSVVVRGRLMTNNMELRLEAARRHVGIALVIEGVAADGFSEGSLVQVLPGVVGREDIARLLYPDRKFLEPKARAFIDFIVGKVEARRRSA